MAADVGLETSTALLSKGMRPGHSVTRLDGSFVPRRRPEEPWRRATPLSRASKELDAAERAQWKQVDAGLWRFLDHITLGEGRAVVRLCRLLASCSRAHAHCVLSLQDNSSIAGAFAKGRSPSPAVNFLARQRAASTTAANVQMMVPWVQTTRQSADAISRDKSLQVRLQAERA